MTTSEHNFSVNVNTLNPGQFFACCGLLELAHRCWPGVEAWFDDNTQFHIKLPKGATGSLKRLIQVLTEAELVSDDPDADKAIAAIRLGGSFDLRLDWWRDGATDLKTWAGRQSVFTIASSMKAAMKSDSTTAFILDHGQVVYDPLKPRESVEPFYFDARRFVHALDTGFSLDTQGFETLAHPATEFLSLIGLQRFRPEPQLERRSFCYWTWLQPLGATVGAAAASGAVSTEGGQKYCFTLRPRDAQKRYKGFSFATQAGEKLT